MVSIRVKITVRVMISVRIGCTSMHLSVNRMNHSFALPAEAGTHFPTTEKWKA